MRPPPPLAYGCREGGGSGMSTRYWGYAGPHGQAGPVSTEELALLLRERMIGAETAVSPVEGAHWAPLAQWLPELVPFATRPLPLAPPVQAPALPPPVAESPISPWEPAPQPAPFAEDSLPFALAPLQPAAPATRRGWTDRKAHPWRRCFARMLDLSLIGGITWVVIGFVWGLLAPAQSQAFFAWMSQPLGRLADVLLTMIVVMPGNALMLGLTGFTPGKWLFGIQVVRPDGRPIGFGAALWRELRVWVQGLALGIPLLSLVTQIAGYSWLTADGHTPWDPPRRRLALHRKMGVGQGLLILVGFILFLAIRVWVMKLSQA